MDQHRSGNTKAINRRQFLATTAGVAGFAGLGSACQRNRALPDSRAMVASPEARQEYLRVLLTEICSLGPRPIGSPEYDQAAKMVKREMERALPEVFLDTFQFERWKLNKPTQFFIGDRAIEVFQAHGTSGTGAAGVEGVLKRMDSKDGLKFAMVDQPGGRELAYLSLSQYGRAVPLPFYHFNRALKCPPIFNIGLQDLSAVMTAADKGEKVRAVSNPEFLPNSSSANVVGRLPGQNREEIVFLAHLDTVYNSPGANDNTATVIAMLMLAHAFSGARNAKTLVFIATTGEEYDKLGAANYVQRRQQEGTFGNIRFLVNLDSVTWGPNLLVHTADEDLIKLVMAIDRRAGLPGTPRWEGRDGFQLDARPFRDDAIRALYVNSDGYDLQHLWHRPEDVPRNVPADCVENWFRVFKEYTTRLMAQ